MAKRKPKPFRVLHLSDPAPVRPPCPDCKAEGCNQCTKGYREGMTVAEAIAFFYRQGRRLEASGALAGTSAVNVGNWVRRGCNEIERLAGTDETEPREDEAEYVRFVMLVLQADAELEGEVIDAWRYWIEYDWRAAADFAAKRFRQAWGQQPRTVEVSGPGGGPIAITARPQLHELQSIIDTMSAGLPALEARATG